MFRKKAAYLTIEASFIIPIILFLYLMIILAALYLYCRCSISLDNYLLAMRGVRFTYGEADCGEVIYGEADQKKWSPEHYVQERLAVVRKSYPYFQVTESGFAKTGNMAGVISRGRGYGSGVEKTFENINPVTAIREGRRR